MAIRSAVKVKQEPRSGERAHGFGAILVFERLRDEILSMELRPGQLIDESNLADRFKVSRSPVREALVRLAAEGAQVAVLERSAEAGAENAGAALAAGRRGTVTASTSSSGDHVGTWWGPGGTTWGPIRSHWGSMCGPLPPTLLFVAVVAAVMATQPEPCCLWSAAT